ncbi:MAG: methyl-accepting chemotaxis protein [Limisphaera sp.]|nr:methyl-accepting chemotaxis protein [Limisphaera sp.]
MRQQSSLAAGSSSQEEVVPVRVGEAVQNVAAWVSDPASTAGQTWREPLESARLQLARMPHTLDTIQRAVSMVLKMADQSHLLSVNAAIEAEKAGEYGLGFAVVAGEVRRLADQTAVAAGEIEEALEELRLQAESGLKSFETLEAVFKRGERMEIPMTLSAFGALPAEPTWPQRPRAGSSAWDEVTDRCRNSLIEFCTSWQEAESLWDEAAQMLAELERMGRSLSELGPAWVGSSTLKRGTGHEPIG